MLTDLLRLAAQARVYDLSQPYFTGMPHHPSHPPFLYSMTKKHGDFVAPGEVSSAAESIAMGSHVGTHIDALCHFSCCGKLHDGSVAAEVQSYAGGIETNLAIAEVAPIFRRGVLIDLATDGPLSEDFVITPELLAAKSRVSINQGDVVLLRTGWAQFWNDAPHYIRQVHGPGPELAGAEWLSGHGIFAAGSDTIAFEKVPAASMPVHVHLLVEKGIHIIEALNLEQLAQDGIAEFLFVAAPLKIRGGTGSPVRALALVI
jgi:kynurenine formamidase